MPECCGNHFTSEAKPQVKTPPSILLDSIRTDRLLLRAWRDDDLLPFAELNSDPEVMTYMPALLDRRESDAFATRIREQFEQRGFGLWAVEIPEMVPFIGYVGLSVPRFTAAFTPCVEVGWRLARAHWGHGYATETARAALTFGFERVGLDEIVSFTVPANARSIAVMERLGMSRDPSDDFDHPSLPAGYPLQRHVLYRLTCTSRS
jgi:RimJ/RimL family protein N-acetyltransferase